MPARPHPRDPRPHKGGDGEHRGDSAHVAHPRPAAISELGRELARDDADRVRVRGRRRAGAEMGTRMGTRARAGGGGGGGEAGVACAGGVECAGVVGVGGCGWGAAWLWAWAWAGARPGAAGKRQGDGEGKEGGDGGEGDEVVCVGREGSSVRLQRHVPPLGLVPGIFILCFLGERADTDAYVHFLRSTGRVADVRPPGCRRGRERPPRRRCRLVARARGRGHTV